jgi:hypothetical protein
MFHSCFQILAARSDADSVELAMSENSSVIPGGGEKLVSRQPEAFSTCLRFVTSPE